MGLVALNYLSVTRVMNAINVVLKSK